VKLAAAVLLVGACALETSPSEQAITGQVKADRLALIRDSAAEMGMHNAALFGGIAMSETNLAHCWSEATYACMGPDSPSCGGPIIAGAADGPCANEQGGLGMFQFDAGTYDQTLALYTDAILTVEGNTAQAVSFVVDKTILDIAGVKTWLDAVAWMDSVPLRAGDPVMEQWAQLLACRYNGCCSGSATCTTRANGYRDHAIELFDEMGADFWQTADRCGTLPADGIIDQRTACYLAGGDPRHWTRVAAGYRDASETTHTQVAAAPTNFAQWIVHTGRASRYRVEVYVAGGTAKAASYQIVHGGTTDTVVIDQSAQSGFVALGDFDFTGKDDEHVALGDNTGTSGDTLVFDAARITPLDGKGPGGGGGGCDAGGGAGSGASIAATLLALGRRRTSRG
jgi:hypothetical protein